MPRKFNPSSRKEEEEIKKRKAKRKSQRAIRNTLLKISYKRIEDLKDTLLSERKFYRGLLKWIALIFLVIGILVGILIGGVFL